MTQTQDPILQAIGTFCRRLLIFCGQTVVLSVALWIWLLMQVFHFSFAQVWSALARVFGEEPEPFTRTIFWGCVTVAVLFVAVLFLIAAHWWKRKGVVHRRGATIVDSPRRG